MEVWKFTCESACPYDGWVTVKRRTAGTLCFQWCLPFYRTFQAKDSKRNTSVITAFIKSSMKSSCGATANCHLSGYGERKRTQRRNK